MYNDYREEYRNTNNDYYEMIYMNTTTVTYFDSGIVEYHYYNTSVYE